MYSVYEYNKGAFSRDTGKANTVMSALNTTLSLLPDNCGLILWEKLSHTAVDVASSIAKM